MMIGGTDHVLIVPATINVTEVILRHCRKHWPEGVVQGGEEETFAPLSDLANRGCDPGAEFFVYEDVATAQRWQADGLSKDTWNRMLHFLIRSREEPGGEKACVTVVVDECTPEIERLLVDLRQALLVGQPQPLP